MTGDWGQDLKLFFQQGTALGWKVKVGNYVLDDPLVMQAVGEAALGQITADAYLSTVDTKENHDLIKAWRARYLNAPVSYKYPTLKRTCDHQMVTQGYIAEVTESETIPADFRYFGNEFLFIGKATLIPKDEITRWLRGDASRRPHVKHMQG